MRLFIVVVWVRVVSFDSVFCMCGVDCRFVLMEKCDVVFVFSSRLVLVFSLVSVLKFFCVRVSWVVSSLGGFSLFLVRVVVSLVMWLCMVVMCLCCVVVRVGLMFWFSVVLRVFSVVCMVFVVVSVVGLVLGWVERVLVVRLCWFCSWVSKVS